MRVVCLFQRKALNPHGKMALVPHVPEGVAFILGGIVLNCRITSAVGG
jgi:hypothetical protein